MEDKNTESNVPAETTTAMEAPKKKSPFKWVVLIISIALIANVMRTREKPSVAWQGYKTGIKNAKEQDKPILISFYKEGQRFSRDMWADTYANQSIIDFIEANFVPIMIDVDKQPDLAKEYEVSYYPLHLLRTPDNKSSIKTNRGYSTPSQFMSIMLEALEKMNRTPK